MKPDFQTKLQEYLDDLKLYNLGIDDVHIHIDDLLSNKYLDKKQQVEYSLMVYPRLVQVVSEHIGEFSITSPLDIVLTIWMEEHTGPFTLKAPQNLEQVIQSLGYTPPEISIQQRGISVKVYEKYKLYSCPINFLEINLPNCTVYFHEFSHIDYPEEVNRTLNIHHPLSLT